MMKLKRKDTIINVLHRINTTTEDRNISYFILEKASKLVLLYSGLGFPGNHSYEKETFGFRVRLLIGKNLKSIYTSPKNRFSFIANSSGIATPDAQCLNRELNRGGVAFYQQTDIAIPFLL